MTIDYTNYDYQSLKNRITELYKDKPGLGQGYEGSTGQTLIQLLADVTDSLHYKLERRSQEVYTATARLESSVWAAVASYGYRPRRAVSASGRLLLELLDEDGNPYPSEGNIEIPYGKKIFFDGVTFTPVEDYVIREGESSIEIDVIQGEVETQEFVFGEDDTPQIEVKDFKDIEEYSINISTNQGKWVDVMEPENGVRLRAINFADETMPVYDIRYTANKMRIIFGDNTFGMKPTGKMNVSWLRSKGAEVNVVRTGREFEFEDDVLFDDVMVTPANEYEYRLTNISPVRGGSSHESIPEIRRNFPDYIRSNDRAVTNLDYEFWAMKSGIGGILDVKAYGEAETNNLVFSMNNVYLSYVTSDRQRINIEQEKFLREYVDQVKVNTTHLVIRPAMRLSLGVNVDFKRHPSLPISNSQLYNELRARIYDYFRICRGSIGRGFQHSEFVEYLQNLTILFNGITYQMTDFVRVSVDGVFPFSIPSPMYDGILTLDTDYPINNGDVWSVKLDGTVYSVTVQSGDTIGIIVNRMRQVLFENSNLMFATPDSNQIRITHPDTEGTYDIEIVESDLSSFTTFSQEFNVPRANNRPRVNEELLLRGSAKIIDSDGNVLLEDNGEGSFEGIAPSSGIDYTKCRFQYPGLTDGNYFFLFQQNEWQNFNVTNESYIDIMPIFKEGDDPNDFFLSSINILE